MRPKPLQAYSIAILLAKTVFLILIVALAYLPVYEQSSSVLDNAELQRTRVERIAKDVLILAYRPTSEHVQAISELQITQLMWSQEQSFLTNTHNADLQQLMMQTQPDYMSVSVALNIILAHTDKKIDPIQLNIILMHERPYLLSINLVVNWLQKAINDQLFWLFLIESGLAFGVLILIICKEFLVVRPLLPKKEIICSD